MRLFFQRGFVSLLLVLAVVAPRVEAIELPFLTYGPAFDLELDPPAPAVSEKLRDALMDQRKQNTEMEIYDTTAKFARAEKATLEKLLRAKGYYQADVSFRIEEDKVRYRAISGPIYRLRKMSFRIPKGVHWPPGGDMGINAGEPLEARKVLEAVERFKSRIASLNCLLDIDAGYTASIDHDTHMAELEFYLNPSEQVNFNQYRISGNTTVETAFLERKITLQSGQCFNRKKLEKARLALLQTNLIASVDQKISPPLDGKVDVEFAVTERNHRTVKTGIGYSTDEGPVLSFGWEHRNLLHGGEKFTIDTRLSEKFQNVDGRITLPEFGHRDQTLEFYGELNREIRDAYEAESVTGGTVLTRFLTPAFSVAGGAQLKLSSVLDGDDRDEYTLLSFPFSATWNTTDDLLDPRKGWILTGQVIPYTDLLNVGTRFMKTIGSGSIYLTADRLPGTPTFAFRGAAGSLSGAGLLQVPADERYYVGGGGSVRGYSYQTLSAYTEGEPDGGRSFIEMSFETRIHHPGNFGTVLFTDGGYAYPQSYPPSQGELLWGAGIGFRYFTAVAPLRFDIAWPLQKREDIDDDFQLYISLGQAF